MKTQKGPGSRLRRLWNLEGWGLRWKVTAVVALPITVATVLGGLQVQDQFSRAVNYSNTADRVAGVPDIVTLSNEFGLLSAGYTAGTFKRSDLGDFNETVVAGRAAAENPAMPADLADLVRSSLVVIEGLVADIESGNMASPNLPAETAKVREDLMRVVDEIVGPIQDPAVIVAYRHLHDLADAQQALTDQVAGMMTHLMDTSKPPSAMVAAGGAELALIDGMMRAYPDSIPVLEKTRDSGQARLNLIINSPASEIQFQMRDLLYGSVNNYTELVGKTSNVIADTVAARADETKTSAIQAAVVVLVTLVATILLGVVVARSLIRPIRRLRRGTLEVANTDLPDAIERIKVGDSEAVTEFDPIPVYTTEEIGQLARAVDDMHGQALRLAGEQAHLRLQIGDMFETLARRSKSLVDQQLGLIESLEFEENDPKRLESLFRLDHLAARMRRNGDNLLILSGNRVRRAQSAPVQLGDLVRAAMSEVEDYQRVQVGSTPQGALSGAAAADVVHLVAELLDNALRASPPGSMVRITFARSIDGGVLIEIADSGIGMPAERFDEVNERLASGGVVGPETARHMGLYVVGRLADRHGLTVRLRPTHEGPSDQGVTASAHLPATLLVSPVEMPSTGPVPRLDSVGLPQVNILPSGAMPKLVIDPVQQETAPAVNPAADLPHRTPGATGLPQRTPGATSLSQRTPGATSLPQRVSAVGGPAPVPADPPQVQHESVQQYSAPSPAPVAAPTPAPAPEPAPEPVVPVPGSSDWAVPAHAEAVDDSPRVRRHRYLSNAAKTASFFQARPNPAASQDVTATGTPIFSGMVTDWLTDPTESGNIGQFEWTSAADEGWTAAHRAGEAPVESRTESGLPQRSPGHRLVPGTVDVGDQGATRRRLRDPEAVREKLSRHQKGTRDGRAASSADHASIGGDR
ncbi:sensor histidine kinase [Prescottella agglutinans]|uniref:histidine kinase n=1 Tax=Prescottella agglutinans TaxID=1644129 RepID=A0ABT6MDH9_9NOCA|nr:ATP-binding protein [Prescottella agglutinans]MDH6282375.1 signal transduction histidine kinase [Prescottella agglutinans]